MLYMSHIISIIIANQNSKIVGPIQPSTFKNLSDIQSIYNSRTD